MIRDLVRGGLYVHGFLGVCAGLGFLGLVGGVVFGVVIWLVVVGLICCDCFWGIVFGDLLCVVWRPSGVVGGLWVLCLDVCVLLLGFTVCQVLDLLLCC